MHAGHVISCFMLRQMEYDADSYEAKLAGSDAFASTASRLRVLNVATQVAYADVRQSWASRRLPENLPLLIDHKAASLPAEVLQRPRGISVSAAPQGDGMPAECGPPCWLSVTAVAAWSAVGALCSAAR